MTVFAWILLTLAAFALLLAMQMRLLIALSLRRALAAQFGGDARDPAYHAAIQSAGRQLADTDLVRHLEAIYPLPLQHLSLARKASLVLPLVMLAVTALARLGVFGGG